jgi:hypothetical protein
MPTACLSILRRCRQSATQAEEGGGAAAALATAKWTPAEDELLALGLLRFGMDFERIAQSVLPAKTTDAIRRRQKLRSAAAAPDGPIKVATETNRMQSVLLACRIGRLAAIRRTRIHSSF